MKNDAAIYVTNHPVTHAAIARHLGICAPMVRPAMDNLGCRLLPGGRYDLTDCGGAFGGYRSRAAGVARGDGEAALVHRGCGRNGGVHPATIRRAGNTRSLKWRLPDHCDLGDRTRRYLPLHIEAWLRGEAPEEWLKRQYRPVGPLGLRLKGASNPQYGGAMQN